MVGQRSVYLNILALLVVLGVVFVLNAAFLNGVISDKIYWIFSKNTRQTGNGNGQLAYDEALERENASLRKQLALPDRPKFELVEAKVIAMERNNLASSVVLNKGSANGLKSGDSVIFGGNILAGKIGEVYEHSARLILVDDPRSVVSVRIYHKDYLAEAQGNLGDKVKINYLSHGDALAKDDLLLTSGLDSFPAGLVVGQIENYSQGSSTLFQDVSGRTFLNFHESNILFVIL